MSPIKLVKLPISSSCYLGKLAESLVSDCGKLGSLAWAAWMRCTRHAWNGECAPTIKYK